MPDSLQQQPGISEQPHVPEALGFGGFVGSVLYGIGVSLGLALLWVMEIFRNMFFRALDWMNIKPRRIRHASAFPPGEPRKKNRSPSSD